MNFYFPGFEPDAAERAQLRFVGGVLDLRQFDKIFISVSGGKDSHAMLFLVRDLADRLLALAYRRMDVSPTLTDALYDLSRAGSFAAMRELVSRFPMDENERAWIIQMLRENGQTE